MAESAGEKMWMRNYVQTNWRERAVCKRCRWASPSILNFVLRLRSGTVDILQILMLSPDDMQAPRHRSAAQLGGTLDKGPRRNENAQNSATRQNITQKGLNAMLKSGDKVLVRVTKICPFGAFFEHEGIKILVLVPEISWIISGPIEDLLEVGEEREVVILRYNDEDDLFMASMKQTEPNKNPYAVIELNEVHDGTVLFVGAGIATVELGNGAFGLIRVSKQASRNLAAGNSVSVKVKRVDKSVGRLELELVRKRL